MADSRYENFDESSLRVMDAAHAAARRFHEEYIGVEHLLLGIVDEEPNEAHAILHDIGVDARRVRLEVERLTKHGPGPVMEGRLPLTPRVKTVFVHARQEALAVGDKEVGPAHLLVGLLTSGDSIASKALREKLGVDDEAVRTVIRMRRQERRDEAVGAVTPVTLLIDPGSATADELKDLLTQLSSLYRSLGGSGVVFTFADAKDPAIA